MSRGPSFTAPVRELRVSTCFVDGPRNHQLLAITIDDDEIESAPTVDRIRIDGRAAAPLYEALGKLLGKVST